MTAKPIRPEQLTLYYSPYCPYCHRVLNALVQMGLTVNTQSGKAGDITLKNTFAERAAKKALVRGGGKSTVPCLLIEDQGKQRWMYESLDIITFLQENLAI